MNKLYDDEYYHIHLLYRALEHRSLGAFSDRTIQHETPINSKALRLK